MEPICVHNIANYSVKIVDGNLIITPKDNLIGHVRKYKKEIPRRKPSPKTPDPNKCVEKHEEFENELWTDKMVSKGRVYTMQERDEFPPCQCSKSEVFHKLLDDSAWFKHRKEVNRYRRMCANNRVIRPLSADALVVPDDSDDEYSLENIICRMDRDELELDLKSKKISFMSGFTDHELRALLRKAYDV